MGELPETGRRRPSRPQVQIGGRGRLPAGAPRPLAGDLGRIGDLAEREAELRGHLVDLLGPGGRGPCRAPLRVAGLRRLEHVGGPVPQRDQRGSSACTEDRARLVRANSVRSASVRSSGAITSSPFTASTRPSSADASRASRSRSPEMSARSMTSTGRRTAAARMLVASGPTTRMASRDPLEISERSSFSRAPRSVPSRGPAGRRAPGGRRHRPAAVPPRSGPRRGDRRP